MASVTVLGSLNIDLVTSVPTLPRRGETVSGTALRSLPGGKGANQAIACARAGATVRMAGVCGCDDAGDRVVEALTSEGIDAHLVRRLPDVDTGIATILVEASGENMIALTPAANALVGTADIEEACATLTPGDVLLMQLEVPATAVRQAAAVAARRGALVVLNAAPVTTDVSGLLADVDVLVVNEQELQELALSFEVAGPDATVPECARRLAVSHDCLVVATLGPGGALATHGDAPRRVTAPPVHAVDTVGAGDTFTGYLAAALSRGADEDSALAEAVRAASIAVTRPGAQEAIPRLTELNQPIAIEGA